jgi:D-inositol-3-phosphate glycosyltransferase
MQLPLKIFIIGPAYPLRGGPAQLNENLCAELIKRGHDAQIISYSLQYPSFLFPGTSQFEQSGTAPTGLKIHALINTVNPLSWQKTARFIKKEKPDFVLFRYWLPFFGPALGTIARLIRKRTTVLALTDNVLPHEKRPGDASFTKYFINSCHGFLTMSKTVMKDLEKFTGNSNKVFTPHPMYETYGKAVSKEEARKKLGIGNDEKLVLFFGLIRQYKGLDILLEGMDNPEVKKLNVKLLIAGEFYEDRKPYLDLISKKNLKDHVLLHDHFISNEDVRYYFCASDLVAQTYRNATNSGVTMVAYYYEKPMIVTNVGGLAEIVPDGKCGYVVDQSPHQIGDAMVDYFSKRREAEFTANVAIEKKKYEWETFIEKLLELFHISKVNH